jgi:formylglycine-generating enzyme required for sulfatase activity
MKKALMILVLSVLILSACKPVDMNASAPVFETGIDPDTWVMIPAGEFLLGQFEKETLIDYDYEIMVTPVTNSQFASYLNEALEDGSIKVIENQIVGYYPGDPFQAGHHEERVEEGDYIYIPLNDPALRLEFDGEKFTAMDTWANHPMTMVSWFGAQAYCGYYDWRLPTEVEWEKAARGTDDRPYPWGYEVAKNNANYISSLDPFEDMRSYGSRTTPVGFYNGKAYDGYQTIDSASPFGLYDMAGNVWQWTSDDYAFQHYRYMRGGSMLVYENNLRIWSRNNATPLFYGPAVGFRCAR